MTLLFYIASAIAVLSTALVISRTNAIHALLYFVVSLLAVALLFFLLGAPFAAALEIILYAGAILVLFVFVVMLLDLGAQAADGERRLLPHGIWFGPCVLATALLLELGYLLFRGGTSGLDGPSPTAREVGAAVMGPYVLGVELASFVLLAGLVGAVHLGRRAPDPGPERRP